MFALRHHSPSKYGKSNDLCELDRIGLRIANAQKKLKGLNSNSQTDQNAEEEEKSVYQNNGKYAVAKDTSPKKEQSSVMKKLQHGRIHFEESVPNSDDIIAPGAPTDLLCEECEKEYSVVYCEACAQVFCPKCVLLVHPRTNLNQELHPHEYGDIIRPLQVGDTSTAPPLDKTFYLPTNDLFEEDYAQLIDLTVPKSLAINTALPDVAKNITPITSSLVKFHANDIVLFLDPISHQEAYGRVCSEWDMRHGEVFTYFRHR